MIFRGPESLQYLSRKEFQHLGEVMDRVRRIQERAQLPELAAAVGSLIPHRFSANGSFHVQMVSLAGHDGFEGIHVSGKSAIGLNDVFAKRDGRGDTLVRVMRNLRFDRRIVPGLRVRRGIEPGRAKFGIYEMEDCLLHASGERRSGSLPDAGEADRIRPARTSARHMKLKAQSWNEMWFDA